MKVLFLLSPVRELPQVLELAIPTLVGNLGPHEGVMLDLYYSDKPVFKAVREAVETVRPQIIALGGMSCQFSVTRRIAEFLRTNYPSILLVAGGWHVSGCLADGLENPGSFLPFDVLIYGEGEHRLREVCDLVAAGDRDFSKVPGIAFRQGETFQRTAERGLQELSTLAVPSRQAYYKEGGQRFFKRRAYFIHCVETTRGCLYNCSFCCSPAIYGSKLRTFPIERTLADLTQLRELGARHILFTDENMTNDLEHFQKLWLEIEQARVHQMHFALYTSTRQLVRHPEIIDVLERFGIIPLIGIESFTKAKLAYFNKQWISGDTNLEALELLRKRRVYPLVSFILGSPEDQVDDLRLPFRTLASIDLNVMISPAVLTPFPGTRLRKQVLEEGLVEDLEYDHYNGITPVLRTRYLSRKEVSRLRNEELVRYYFRPRYLKNLAREVWRRRLPLVLIQFLQMFTPIYYLNSDFSVRLDRRWLRLLLKLIRTPTKRIDQVSWK
ncbi:MAG: hypothetical protein A2284_09515 [Deltaproteobacteria bacterium RIFOXYA12_FULL_61_11]|nr:MAG: hypothetical protein A2284_09515 [Deltaproteobacteria bacterium RIFOXYA12_FULL_61_11]